MAKAPQSIPEIRAETAALREKVRHALLADYERCLSLLRHAGECLADPDRVWPPLLLRDIGRIFIEAADAGLDELEALP